jgi:ABC-type uncharacterized transport system permease subunit
MYKLMTLVVILPAAAGLVVAFRPALHPTLWMVVAFLIALLLAIALRFLVEWTLGLLALWVTRMSAVRQMYAVALLFLSGQVAPLSLFPLPVQTATALLPFRWMVAFPVDVLLGHETAGQTLIGLAAQGTWASWVLSPWPGRCLPRRGGSGQGACGTTSAPRPEGRCVIRWALVHLREGVSGHGSVGCSACHGAR